MQVGNELTPARLIGHYCPGYESSGVRGPLSGFHSETHHIISCCFTQKITLLRYNLNISMFFFFQRSLP